MLRLLLLLCLHNFFISVALAASFTLVPAAGNLPPLPEEKFFPLENADSLNPLVTAIENKRVLMLGESSHGTHEFYRWRDIISRRLISEQHFRLILVEGDFASLYEVNRYIKHWPGAARSGRELLQQLDRWPQWLWANEETLALVEWLRQYNSQRPEQERVGFYGMDLYDHRRSAEALLALLKKHNRRLYRAAQSPLRCMAPYGKDAWAYARAVKAGKANCALAVSDLLKQMEGEDPALTTLDPHARFALQQHARVIHSAEGFYRTALIEGDSTSWNIRADHMQKTLAALLEHYGSDARAIVWAHNSHVGDARFAQMTKSGHRNVAQLAREHWGKAAILLVGFSNYQGKTLAALAWGQPVAEMTQPPPQPGTIEAWLGQAAAGDFFWIFDEADRSNSALSAIRNQRAVGVVYRPANDSAHYEPTTLTQRYDVLLFFRSTQALRPLALPGR